MFVVSAVEENAHTCIMCLTSNIYTDHMSSHMLPHDMRRQTLLLALDYERPFNRLSTWHSSGSECVVNSHPSNVCQCKVSLPYDVVSIINSLSL